MKYFLVAKYFLGGEIFSKIQNIKIDNIKILALFALVVLMVFLDCMSLVTPPSALIHSRDPNEVLKGIKNVLTSPGKNFGQIGKLS